VGDLARWADITKREAAAAIAAVDHTLESARHEGATYWFEPGLAPAPRSGSPRLHLLPGFDEYMLGYVGRAHQLGAHLDAYGSRVAANGMLAPTVVLNGRAVGVWKRTLRTRSVSFETTEFEPLPKRAQAALVREQQSYARFVGREVRDTRPTAR
jgi:hypothetical protein